MGTAGDYLRHLYVRNLRPNTIAQAERILRWFAEFINDDPANATSHQIEGFLARREHAATRAVEWSYLAGFYKWAIRFDVLDKNPMDRTERPRVPKRKPRPMPLGDVARILHDSPERLRPWFYLATYCGLRSCDIAPLRAEHVLWIDNVLLIPETKGGGERLVPIPPVVLAVLHALPRSGWLFPRLDGKDGHVTPHLISELTNRYLRSVGARESFHGLRHWYASELLRETQNVRVVQELLGHATINHVMLYTQVGLDEMIDAANRLRVVA